MKKLLAVCAGLILLSFSLIPNTNVYSQRRDSSQQLFADDQIIVKFKANVEAVPDADSIAEEIIRTPGATAETLTRQRRGDVKLIHLNRSVSVEAAVQRAKEDPRVEYAEPDYFVYAMDTVPNDTYFNQMWGLSNVGNPGTPNIDATKAWDITTGSDDIVVAVLDTAVNLEHDDLVANKWVNPRPGSLPGFVGDINGWNFVDGNGQTFDPNTDNSTPGRHGTHVAGSIGAVGNNVIGVTGVAWRVKLMSLKFLRGTDGKGSTSNAVNGINYAIGMRNLGVNVRVINASWGGGSESQALRDAIAAANDAGILFVCAAGNGGTNADITPDFPASYSRDLPNAVSVGAVDQGGYLASFSNFGHDSVSLAAPGVGICSTIPGGYSCGYSGTSMSTPYVSGIAVLLWSREPSLTPAQVKQRIVDTSEPLADLVSRVARSGRANAYYALINRIPPVQSPVVLRVQFSKKTVTLDGFGFVNGSAMIEVDGTPLPTVDYDSSFALANGTLTRLTANLGKKPLRRAFPSGVYVGVDVFNPTTGERSQRYSTARF